MLEFQDAVDLMRHYDAVKARLNGPRTVKNVVVLSKPPKEKDPIPEPPKPIVEPILPIPTIGMPPPDFVEPPKIRIFWNEMVELVERRTGISRGEILGPRRVLEVIKARHLLWGLAYICAPHLSVAQIGRLSNRDHTTILHGFRKGREHPLYEELKAELLSRLPIEPLAREKGE
jgi:hypothetical protein